MNLVPWKNKSEKNGGSLGIDPAMTRFRQEVDDLFARFFGRGAFDWPATMLQGSSGLPKLDLAETDREVTVTAELPGVTAKDIDIHVTGNQLTIKGEKKQDCEQKGRDYCYTERQYGSFHRVVQLPAEVNPDKVNATFKDGVLNVTIAKQPGAQPKRIPVKTQ